MRTTIKPITISILTVVLVLVALYTLVNVTVVPEADILTPEDKPQTLEDSVVYKITKLQFEHPHIILAQAKHESGHFTSRAFKRNNNMFGMKMPSRRPTAATRQKGSYAYYETWQHSVIDLRIYYALYLNNKTEEEVYSYLSKYYAEDPNYVRSIKAMIQKENLKDKFVNDNII
jgi:hypothetical protein